MPKMKIESYSVCGPVEGLTKQFAVWGNEGFKTAPLMYLQRPKWITDDVVWEPICRSIELALPKDFEIG